MPGPPLRLLIIDDHDLFRSGLRRLLQDEGLEVAEASRAPAGLRLAETFGPDVVLMDVHMPEMDGITATRELLRREGPAPAVVMLTVASDDESVLAAVRAGARGYVLKDTPLPEILAAVSAAAAGQSVVTPRVARALVDALQDGAAPQVLPEVADVSSLSAREREILVLMTRGYENTDIAERLFVSPSTVKSHISAIFQKLGVDNRVQAAVYAVRAGIAGDEA